MMMSSERRWAQRMKFMYLEEPYAGWWYNSVDGEFVNHILLNAEKYVKGVDVKCVRLTMIWMWLPILWEKVDELNEIKYMNQLLN